MLVAARTRDMAPEAAVAAAITVAAAEEREAALTASVAVVAAAVAALHTQNRKLPMFMTKPERAQWLTVR